MAEEAAVETFFDYLDQVATKLYKSRKVPYLKGVSEALQYLLDDKTSMQLDNDTETGLQEYKLTVTEQPFDKETVRRAIQLALLKGFKHENITNSMVTPDSIGMFMAYLAKKLHPETPARSILDPLAGTGNLLATFHNHYNEESVLIGIDSDALLCRLARNMLDALEAESQIFHQDTLTYKGVPADMIVCDFPVETVDRRHAYFPYQVVLHHLQHLRPGGYFLSLVENDFFDQHEKERFKDTLLEEAHLVGLVKLDEGLFENHPQSILIMQKKIDENDKHPEDFLLVDLPPFRDEQAFPQALQKIEQWFENKRG